MQSAFIFIFSILIFSFCSSKSEVKTDSTSQNHSSNPDTLLSKSIDSSKIDTAALQINFTPSSNYTPEKSSVTAIKSKLKSANDSLKKIALENLILNQLIPHWYGTKWDFSGYTDVPNQGVIACGYFVSTVMKHAGFNVNRYKLAQQDPLNEAKTVACGDSVDIYEVNSSELQNIFNEKYTEGLYFVGLDFHVGFLLFRNKELYFIHSNYIAAEGVVFEKAIYSEAFNAASKYRIAEFSTNKFLMGKWMNNETILVISSKP